MLYRDEFAHPSVEAAILSGDEIIRQLADPNESGKSH
jgi:hypothetical protein